MRYLMPVLAVLLLVLLVLTFFALKYSNKVLYPKTKSYERARKKIEDQNAYDAEYVEPLPYESLLIRSPYGYLLKGRLYPGTTNRYVILVHGITMNLFGALKFLPLFHKKGFNVVVYDQRHHGQSGGANTTYGYFEKWDLQTVVDHLFAQYGPDITVGLHGESMGASISILTMALEPRVDFAIADSGYSDLPELYEKRAQEVYHIRSKKFIYLVNQVVKRKSGFSIEDVSPVKELPGIQGPILFIHGEADTYIPVAMSRSMYSFKINNKYIHTVEEAEHLECLSTNPYGYDEAVTDFLNVVYPEDGFTKSL